MLVVDTSAEQLQLGRLTAPNSLLLASIINVESHIQHLQLQQPLIDQEHRLGSDGIAHQVEMSQPLQ